MRDLCWTLLLSSRFDYLLTFSIPSCSQKDIHQGCLVTPVLSGPFCLHQWKYLIFSTVCSSPLLVEERQFASPWIPSGLVIVSWWPTQFKTQHSVLITLHIQSIALISWPAWSKANDRAACGTGTHRPLSQYGNLVPLKAGQNFCSPGNRAMQKWWNCSVHRHGPLWLGKVLPPPVAHTAVGSTLHDCWTSVSQHSYTFCRMGYL